MARSNRRPYAACTGLCSARIDKQIAARSFRRKQNQHLKTNWEEEDFLLSHRFESNNNDVWGWDRDVHQHLQVPDARDWTGSAWRSMVFILTTNGQDAVVQEEKAKGNRLGIINGNEVVAQIVGI